MSDAAALNRIERQWEAGQRDVAWSALTDYLTKYPEDHYAGDFTIPGLVSPQHCYTFKSKINVSTGLDTTTGQNNVQPTRSAFSNPVTSDQMWCIVPI